MPWCRTDAGRAEKGRRVHQDLGAGKGNLFVGPLYLQDGSEYLKAGEKASDDKIWYLPQLLRAWKAPAPSRQS